LETYGMERRDNLSSKAYRSNGARALRDHPTSVPARARIGRPGGAPPAGGRHPGADRPAADALGPRQASVGTVRDLRQPARAGRLRPVVQVLQPSRPAVGPRTTTGNPRAGGGRHGDSYLDLVPRGSRLGPEEEPVARH